MKDFSEVLKMPMKEMLLYIEEESKPKAQGLIYKYRPLFTKNDDVNQFTQDLLTKSCLFFSDPILFNDPFDAETIVAFTKNFSDLAKSVLLMSDTDSLEMKNHNQILKGNIIEDPEYFNDSKGTGWAAGFLKVFCASKKFDIPSMWAHYSADHTGICIGIKTYEILGERVIKIIPDMLNTVEPLDSTIPNPILKETLHVMKRLGIVASSLVQDEYFAISDVAYTNGIWDSSESQSEAGLFFSSDRLVQKAICWESEQEVRSIISFFDSCDGKCFLAQGEIREIIFGNRVTDDKIAEFFKLLANSIPLIDGIDFYKLEKKLGTFEFERHPITVSVYL